jgi:hypothetical protein
MGKIDIKDFRVFGGARTESLADCVYVLGNPAS